MRITLGVTSYALLTFSCWLWGMGVVHGFEKNPLPYVATFPIIAFLKWRWFIGTTETLLEKE